MAQQYPGGISGSGTGDPEEDCPATNDETHSAVGGVFKPNATSTRCGMDSPDTTEGDAPTTATEQRRENDAETKMPKEATVRGFSRRPVGRTGGGEAHRPVMLWEERGLVGYDPTTKRGEWES
ncbi:hypothetical protein NDU88_002456 [Pleurodeles waltl]|uniref:Uncharacterized protein n=1 Tax=Pleurodeles waltl TaxID=8319 RepID=A0AAV7UBI3_PLEWA|nr:hypothetical protein NDU88_002456 [Pleurodeles waltl]